MDKSEAGPKVSIVELTADIVSAYVANNSVQRSDVVALIGYVHESLASLGRNKLEGPVERPTPAISIKKTVSPDFLISLEDGRRYKSLKRHLNGRDMTPEQYREKWGLPYDYPMVAANYAKQRSELAKSMGLGTQRRKVEVVEAARPPAPTKTKRTARRTG